MLCYNAVHAAVSQGLHREAECLIGSSPDNSLQRAWLWWAIYTLEKRLSLNSGKPSVIDDYIMSTPVPSAVPLNSSMDLDCLAFTIRHAKICSRISREIMSTKATKLSANGLCEVVKDLDQQLKSLLNEVPTSLRIGTLGKLSEEVHLTSRHIYILYLHFSIHASLLAVHSHFFYPWHSSRFLNYNLGTMLDDQVAFSVKTTAEAARKILLAVRTVTTNVATPTWLAVSYPIYAHLSLFVYVLRYPTLPTASADLGLLDICAGHFGYIDFMTSSEISVSLPRDSVNLAAKVVKTATKRQGNDQTGSLCHMRGNPSIGAPCASLDGISPFNTRSQPASTAPNQVSGLVLPSSSPSRS